MTIENPVVYVLVKMITDLICELVVTTSQFKLVFIQNDNIEGDKIEVITRTDKTYSLFNIVENSIAKVHPLQLPNMLKELMIAKHKIEAGGSSLRYEFDEKGNVTYCPEINVYY